MIQVEPGAGSIPRPSLEEPLPAVDGNEIVSADAGPFYGRLRSRIESGTFTG